MPTFLGMPFNSIDRAIFCQVHMKNRVDSSHEKSGHSLMNCHMQKQIDSRTRKPGWQPHVKFGRNRVDSHIPKTRLKGSIRHRNGQRRNAFSFSAAPGLIFSYKIPIPRVKVLFRAPRLRAYAAMKRSFRTALDKKVLSAIYSALAPSRSPFSSSEASSESSSVI